MKQHKVSGFKVTSFALTVCHLGHQLQVGSFSTIFLKKTSTYTHTSKCKISLHYLNQNLYLKLSFSPQPPQAMESTYFYPVSIFYDDLFTGTGPNVCSWTLTLKRDYNDIVSKITCLSTRFTNLQKQIKSIWVLEFLILWRFCIKFSGKNDRLPTSKEQIYIEI